VSLNKNSPEFSRMSEIKTLEMLIEFWKNKFSKHEYLFSPEAISKRIKQLEKELKIAKTKKLIS